MSIHSGMVVPLFFLFLVGLGSSGDACAESARDAFQPYTTPRTQRQESFEFTRQPSVKYLGEDKYEVTFTAKGFCDATVTVFDENGHAIRHLASGVLGKNAPEPFQKNSLSQRIIWDGKDELDVYHKHPEKLQIRVGLGLKPTFHRILGWHEYDAAAWDVSSSYRAYRAVAADESGVYVLSARHPQLRQYDHDGKYVRTILPPPADLALEKQKGAHAVEGAPGLKEPVAPYISPLFPLSQHVQISKGHLIYASGGLKSPLRIHRLSLKDGTYSTVSHTWPTPTKSAAQQLNGMKSASLKLAIAPDESAIYVSGFFTAWYKASSFAVHRLDARKVQSDTVFAGELRNGASDANHFQRPEGIDVDVQGRLYVCDVYNDRIQVFSPQAKLLKSIKIRQPYLVRLDKKRGGIYVLHVTGKGDKRAYSVTRLNRFEDPKPMASFELVKLGKANIYAKGNDELLFAVDGWADKPRVWVQPDAFNMQVFEDRGKSFVKVLDFFEKTKKSGLKPHMANANSTGAVGTYRVCADPTREKLIYDGFGNAAIIYDLKSGAFETRKLPVSDFLYDHGIDARGFLMTHVSGSIARHDPRIKYVEIPFDYGVTNANSGQSYGIEHCSGVIALKDQAGGRGYQDGMGVNARGDIAVVSAIYHIPRFDAQEIKGWSQAGNVIGSVAHGGQALQANAAFANSMAQRLKRGESIYSIRPTAGRILGGDTIWVYDATGELRSEDVITGLGQCAGVQIDKRGNLYTMFNFARHINGRPFLSSKRTMVGSKETGSPSMGTFMKTPPSGAKVYVTSAHIKMQTWPKRPMDFEGGWVDGAEWLYPGSSGHSHRHWTDWYGRSFVNENWRHSVGVLDVNGNVVMHVGRYGNADSGCGERSKVKIKGGITFASVAAISGTDQYMCVVDLASERIVVLKMDYHNEKRLALKVK